MVSFKFIPIALSCLLVASVQASPEPKAFPGAVIQARQYGYGDSGSSSSGSSAASSNNTGNTTKSDAGRLLSSGVVKMEILAAVVGLGLLY